MKTKIQILIQVMIAIVLLCFPAALPTIKHQGIISGMLLLPIIGMFSLSGPFASLIFDVPFSTGIIFNEGFFAISITLLLVVTRQYIVHKNKNYLYKLVGVLWLSVGAYYSSLGILLSI